MADPTTYHDVTPQQGARFFSVPDTGPVVMLNLLRFRDRADYSHAPELEPEGGASGAEAYATYMREMEPLLNATGGEVLFSGEASHFLIGPESVTWDRVLLVKQASRQAFMAFASDPAAQRVTAHRTAAIADSRLLPVKQDQ